MSNKVTKPVKLNKRMIVFRAEKEGKRSNPMERVHYKGGDPEVLGWTWGTTKLGAHEKCNGSYGIPKNAVKDADDAKYFYYGIPFAQCTCVEIEKACELGEMK